MDRPTAARNPAAAVYRRLLLPSTAAAMVCAGLVFAWARLLPTPRAVRADSLPASYVTLLVAYFGVAAPVAFWRTWAFYRPIIRVYAEGRAPTPDEQQQLLQMPVRHAVHNFCHWVVAAVVFSTVAIVAGDPRLAVFQLATAILLGGLSSSAVVYLLVEAGHRPLASDFLQGRALRGKTVLGVSQRLLVGWLLGSGVSLLAVLAAPLDLGPDERGAAVPVMVMAAGLGLVGGWLLVWVTARSVTRRLRQVSQALQQVEEGDLGVTVPVDDGGEVGQLQGSFNHMVAGLRELTEANARLTAEVQAQLAEVRASRVRIVSAGDAARRRVERDLHDGAQQRLVALGLSLRMAHTAAASSGSPELVNLIDASRRELQQALRELRELAAGIHPTLLSEAGLAAAVTDLVQRCPVPATVVELPEAPLPAPLEAAAYYTVAEGLTNTVKHAHATHIRVSVLADGGQLLVGVADDGIGGAVLGRGSGLVGLDDRVSSFGGTLTLHSRPGHGTTLWATFPIMEDPTEPATGGAAEEPTGALTNES